MRLPWFQRQSGTPLDASRASDFYRAVSLYLVSRAALALFVWLTGQHFTCQGPRCLDRAFFPTNFLLNGLFQWDAHQYAKLIQDGYYLGAGYDTTAVFFPGFPLSAWLVGKLVGSPLAGGIVVSHLSSIAAAFLIARICRHLNIGEASQPSDAVARESTLFWLASPLTFFFCVFLSESLFAFASVWMVWSVVTGRWGQVLLSGILATSTRNAGVIVVVACAGLAWERREQVRPGVLGWSCLALSPLGLAAFMAWQHHKLGNALAWAETQLRWNRYLTTPWRTIADDWQGWPRLNERSIDRMYRAQELLALALTAPLFLSRGRLGIPWSLLFLGVVEWIMPLTSHGIVSAARYQAGNVYFALAIPALLAPRPTLRGLCWMLFGMVLAWYASTFPYGVWAS